MDKNHPLGTAQTLTEISAALQHYQDRLTTKLDGRVAVECEFIIGVDAAIDGYTVLLKCWTPKACLYCEYFGKSVSLEELSGVVTNAVKFCEEAGLKDLPIYITL